MAWTHKVWGGGGATWTGQPIYPSPGLQVLLSEYIADQKRHLLMRQLLSGRRLNQSYPREFRVGIGETESLHPLDDA